MIRIFQLDTKLSLGDYQIFKVLFEHYLATALPMSLTNDMLSVSDSDQFGFKLLNM